MNKSDKEYVVDNNLNTHFVNVNLNSCNGFQHGLIGPLPKHITTIHKSDFVGLIIKKGRMCI